MKMLRSLVVLASVLLVSACSTDYYSEVKAVNQTNSVGNAFTQKLAAEYSNLVNQELQTYNDHADSLHFSRKGLAAARGDMVMPEAISDWDVNEGHMSELIATRARLVNVFANGARELQPDLSAFTQVRFDCWIEEQEENFQPQNISTCKSQFMDGLAQLEATIAPAPPAPAPQAMVEQPFDVDPSQPMKVENAKYIVFFDFDKHNLNAGANSILDAAAEEARGRNLVAINLVGHTDTSGSRDYNQRLSMKRANAVRDGMVARGVDANLLSLSHRGEDELLVNTADGVREPANRRTEITFQ